MSDSVRRLGWFLGALSVAAPVGTAGAQTAAEYQRRIAQLQRVYAAESLRESAEIRSPRYRVDTLRAGNLLMYSPPDVSALVGEAATLAWPDIERTFGSEAKALDTLPIIVLVNQDDLWSNEIARAHPQATVLPVSSSQEPDDVASALRNAASRMISRGDSALDSWSPRAVSAAAFRPGGEKAAVAREAFEELATTASISARRCLLGSSVSCGQALGVYPVANPVTDLYDAADLRALVRARPSLRFGGLVPLFDQCVEEGKSVACAELLTHQQGPPPLPLSPNARLSLIHVALDRGGSGAYSRLRQTSGPLAERLASAAQMPADSLLAAWRVEALAAGGHSVKLTARHGWIALGWMVAFGLLSLRSTRWR